MKLFIISASLACAFATLTPLSAQVISAVDQGNYDEFEFHDPTFNGYATGWFQSAPEYRSFFVFDTSSISGQITGASLKIFNPSPTADYPEAGFHSPQLSESLAIFSVESDPIALVNGTVNAFGDLASGTQFGNALLTDDANGKWISISLNAPFLDMINKQKGLFALGAAISSLSRDEGLEVVFAGSGENLAKLYVSTVPEASSYGLLAAGFLGVLLLRRVQRRKAD